MQKRTGLIIAAIPLLAGCAVPAMEPATSRYDVGNVPEQVASLAAPGQDLSTARLVAEDNCYWYVHNGPVETTLVPLRAAGGNPICLQKQA